MELISEHIAELDLQRVHALLIAAHVVLAILVEQRHTVSLPEVALGGVGQLQVVVDRQLEGP